MSLGRRQVVAGLAGAAGLAASGLVRAIGPGSKFKIGQVITPGGDWNPRPTAIRRLQWQLDLRTSIDAARDPVNLRLDDGRLHETPFLYLAGDRAFQPPSARELERLRRFLTFGGFLLIDNAEGRAGGPFDEAARRLVTALFPRGPALEALSPEHVIYKSFYLVDRPAGRVLASPVLEAVTIDKRATIVYSANDLGGAWERDDVGGWVHPCIPGGEAQREMAFRLGINLAMYALCLDYKEDQVHVPFILKRRRWKPDP